METGVLICRKEITCYCNISNIYKKKNCNLNQTKAFQSMILQILRNYVY